MNVVLAAILTLGALRMVSSAAEGGRPEVFGLVQQIDLYVAQNGVYPSTEQGIHALVERPATAPKPTRWRKLLKDVPLDPWGNPYQYRFPARRSKAKFDVFSAGPDGKAETPDDIGNW